MHRYLQGFIDTISRTGIYLPLLIAFFLLFGWMIVPALPYSAADFAVQTNGGSSLDMMIGYSPEKAYEVLDGYGADGRAYYVRKLLINDTVFPIAYSLLFAGTLAVLLKRLTGKDSRLRYLAFLPLAGGVLDLAENVGIITMLLTYPGSMEWIARATSLITAVKLSINLIAMALIVAGIVMIIYQMLRNRAEQADARR